VLIRLTEHNTILLIEGLVSAGKVEFIRLIQVFGKIAPNSIIQMVNGSVIIGYDHVLFAVLNALNARKNRRMICEDLSLEILVYLSAQRQIKNSMEMLGVRDETKQLVMIAISENQTELERLKESAPHVADLTSDNSFLNSCSDEKLDLVKRTFRISDAELESVGRRPLSEKEKLERLIVEKIALLAVSV